MLRGVHLKCLFVELRKLRSTNKHFIGNFIFIVGMPECHRNKVKENNAELNGLSEAKDVNEALCGRSEASPALEGSVRIYDV